MDSHKRILGILMVVLSSLHLLIMLFLNFFLTTLFAFAISNAEPKDVEILELVFGIVRYIPIFFAVFIAIPGLIAGIGLLTRQPWALVLALIVGCLGIFSFPLGTALGIYSIWIYVENNKLTKTATVQ